jgi:hypothetical protein
LTGCKNGFAASFQAMNKAASDDLKEMFVAKRGLVWLENVG